MAEATTVPNYNSLGEFLDTLPRRPCEATPDNRYFCTVCERLNKPIAIRCNYSKYKGEGSLPEADSDQPIHFLQISEEAGTGSPAPAVGEQTLVKDKVEFKVVAPMKSDEDFPLIELVQPKDKKIEPIEMELLEDVAIEFELSKDEPMEVEAVEVELVGEDEDADSDLDDLPEVAEIVEVEALEVDTFDSDLEEPQENDGVLEFKPVGESSIDTTTPKPITKPVKKMKPKKSKKKLTKKPMKKSAKKPMKKPVKTSKHTKKQKPKHVKGQSTAPPQPQHQTMPQSPTPQVAVVPPQPQARPQPHAHPSPQPRIAAQPQPTIPTTATSTTPTPTPKVRVDSSPQSERSWQPPDDNSATTPTPKIATQTNPQTSQAPKPKVKTVKRITKKKIAN